MLTPWKESYEQPRQHIKKQRHCFANKGSSNSHAFRPTISNSCLLLLHLVLSILHEFLNPVHNSVNSLIIKLSLVKPLEYSISFLLCPLIITLMAGSEKRTEMASDYFNEKSGTGEDRHLGRSCCDQGI